MKTIDIPVVLRLTIPEDEDLTAAARHALQFFSEGGAPGAPCRGLFVETHPRRIGEANPNKIQLRVHVSLLGGLDGYKYNVGKESPPEILGAIEGLPGDSLTVERRISITGPREDVLEQLKKSVPDGVPWTSRAGLCLRVDTQTAYTETARWDASPEKT